MASKPDPLRSSSEPSGQDVQPVTCPECGKSVSGGMALAIHRKNAHGVTLPEGFRRERMRGFVPAILVTTILMILWVPIAAFTRGLLGIGGTSFSVFNLILSVPAIAVAVGFAIKGRLAVSAGILAGTAIGLLVAWLSCFALLGL